MRNVAIEDFPQADWTGGGGVALSPSGRLALFPAGAPRIVPGAGLLLEPAATNRIAADNVRPANLQDFEVTGGALEIIDDHEALHHARDARSNAPIFHDLLTARVMNGKVYRLRNTHPDEEAMAVIPGSIGAVREHAIAAYVRCLSGSGALRLTGSASGVAFDNEAWRRVQRSNLTPASRESRLAVVARPGADVLFILMDLQNLPTITSPICTRGAPTRRSADRLVIDDLGDQLRLPLTLELDAQMDAADGQFTPLVRVASSRGGGEAAICRTQDNALSATMTHAVLRPRVPNCVGPGSIKAALALRPQGRILAFGGALAYDPFSAPPETLDRLILGHSGNGRKSGGTFWLRRLLIGGFLGQAALAANTVPAFDCAASEVHRYIDPAGDDAADGKTPETAWASLAMAHHESIPAGAVVMLKRGGVWPGGLLPKSNCTYGAYGEGAKPRLGEGVEYAVDDNNASAVRLQDLMLSGATIRGINVDGGPTNGCGGWQIVRVDVQNIAAGQPETNRAGIAIRRTSNAYLGMVRIRDVVGDCVFAEAVKGQLIDEAADYGTPQGVAADCFQATACEEVIIRHPVMSMQLQPTNSGKGAITVQSTSLLIEDFDLTGLNFVISLLGDNVTVRRGVCRGARMNTYSWGIGASSTSDQRTHLYEDVRIENCTRGVASSSSAGSIDTGPNHFDIVTRNVVVQGCDVGLRIDRPTSGDFSGLTFEDCKTNMQILSKVAPAGGKYTALITPPS
ncbi:hypothetical protein [Caulobacter sp. AP07]|uniref:hypothetical protein n=1 Tax=Caulobacter sp. AP07 TaxID=1144304 RepID=UPI0012FAAF42|nr:hypothetical protein [Caulobacter sp. AP07]